MITLDWEREFAIEDPDDDNALFFARAMAELLWDTLELLKQAREKYRILDKTLDRNDDWTLTEADVQLAYRKVWALQVNVIWAAHQAYKWISKLSHHLGDQTPKMVQDLREVRNALEHLDEARISDNGSRAEPKGKKDRALSALDGLDLHASDEHQLFNRLTCESLQNIASTFLGYLMGLQDDYAENYYAQEQIDIARGK